MATLRTYRCECGYEVQTEPEIISISADDLASQRYLPKCPKCGAENEKIHNWNPIEGRCPKCGKKLHEVPGMIVMAD